MGKPDATDNEIIDALKKTNAWEFVKNQPQGIETNVGAGGNQLSGGQKQRIALARAFIKKPKLLIFDEATSALDKVNEAEVQKAIEGMKKELGQVTTIVIAHRLSTVRNSDRIIVMKKGRIAEDGDHNSLLRDYPKGTYAKLVNTQKQAEKMEEESFRQEEAAAQPQVEINVKLDNLALPDPSINKPAEEVPSKHSGQAQQPGYETDRALKNHVETEFDYEDEKEIEMIEIADNQP